MSASRDQLHPAGPAPTGASIPTAIARHKLLFGVVAGAVTLAAVGVGLATPKTYRATAVALLNDQGAGDTSSAVAADRFANEQLALFGLDELQADIARRATADLAARQRRAAGIELTIGAGATAVVSPSGALRLVGPGGGTVIGPDGSVATNGGQTLRARADGVVVDATGQPVVDRDGHTVRVSPQGQLVVGSDGTLLVVETTSIRAVSPTGAVDTVGPATAASAGSVPGGQPGQAPSNSALTVSASGRVTVRSDHYLVSVVPGARATVADANGTEVLAPGGAEPAGLRDHLLVLGAGGNVATARVETAQPGQPSGLAVTVGDTSGAVVVIDSAGRITEIAGAAAIGSGGEALPARRFTPAEVHDSLAPRARPNSALLDINYRDADSERALAGANAAAAAYIAFTERASATAQGQTASLVATNQRIAEVSSELRDVEARLTAAAATNEPQPAALITTRDQLRQRLQSLLADRDRAESNPPAARPTISFMSEASRVSAERGLGPARLGILGLVLGSALAAVAAFAAELRRPRVAGTREIESILGVPLLAEVPDHRHEHIDSQLPVADQPTTFAAEAYRFAAAALGIAREERSYRRIGVVSASVGDGKTTVVANVATALASAHSNVVAVDADLEGQVLSFLLHRAGGVSDHWQGLADTLAGECSLDDALCPLSLPPSELTLLSGGTGAGRARTQLGTDAARHTFDELARRFDIAVVDLPPLLNLAYVGRALRDLDAVVVVVPLRCPRRDLTELADRLRFIGVPVAGYIITRAPLRSERTASISALQYDLGGHPTDRKRHSRRARGVRVGG